MVVETEHGRYGFVVDQVLGDHQTVIKNLGKLYRNVQVSLRSHHPRQRDGGADSRSAPAGAERCPGKPCLGTSRSPRAKFAPGSGKHKY